jgi:hypothetical protein
MNTEETRVQVSGRQGRDHGDDERGVESARDRDLSSVEILRDLGLSKEKIVAYRHRFPTPTPGPYKADFFGFRSRAIRCARRSKQP